MNAHSEANLNRMASDIHLVTAPVRWAWEYVKFVVGFTLTIFALPLVLIALAIHRMVTGHPLFVFEVAIPALYYIFGPLITLLVYCWCTYSYGKGYRGIHPMYIFALTVLLVMASPFVGFWHSVGRDAEGAHILFLTTEKGFTALVAYLSSPILLALYRGPQTKKGFLWGTTIVISILSYLFVSAFALFGMMMNM